MSDTTAEKPAKTRRGVDAELQAMAKVDRIIADLSSEQQSRVIEWLRSRFNSRHTVAYTGGHPEPGKDTP